MLHYPGKRKDRKNRVMKLAFEWVKWTPEEIGYLFSEFCKEKGISGPQHKALREHILIISTDLIKKFLGEDSPSA